MNIDEPWAYIELQKSLFPDKFFGIIASNNKFYSIKIKGGVWIHYPSWSSTINNKQDLAVLKFPVRLHLEDLPPYECLMDLYKASHPNGLKMGQWFIITYVWGQKLSHNLHEERDTRIAYKMIFDMYYKV
jgi:hypothetical protein